mmetsp:Transcript_25009/g.62582  ORF Transcript_25009/g.62582 Transcript_25009/m.62582 type:complete len:120 (-) Transcript_25009:203-562(-)
MTALKRKLKRLVTTGDDEPPPSESDVESAAEPVGAAGEPGNARVRPVADDPAPPVFPSVFEETVNRPPFDGSAPDTPAPPIGNPSFENESIAAFFVQPPPAGCNGETPTTRNMEGEDYS